MSKPANELFDFFKFLASSLEPETRYPTYTRETKKQSIVFAVGDFVNGRLVDYTMCRPEWGVDFRAPRTVRQVQRRIMTGWMYHWAKKTPEG